MNTTQTTSERPSRNILPAPMPDAFCRDWALWDIQNTRPSNYLISIKIPAQGQQAEISASENVTVAAGQTAVVNLQLKVPTTA